MSVGKSAAWLATTILVIGSIILIGNTGGTREPGSAQSRWAKVDLTRYCGKTIKELIEVLGHDFDTIVPMEEPPFEVCGFGFIYDVHSRIDLFPKESIYPGEYDYYLDSLWGYENIKEYRIAHIEAYFFMKEGENNEN